MSEKTPTRKQYDLLLMLGSGGAWLSATKSKCEPLLRHGWVTADWEPPYYQWARITPDGLRALALGVARFGLPSLGGHATYVKVCADCGRDWRPRCRCGGRAYRNEERPVPVKAGV